MAKINIPGFIHAIPATERAFDWIAVALIAAGMTYLALQFFGVAS